MTPAQKQVYDAIKELTRELDVAPTVREVGAKTGHSASNTQRKLKVLRREGYITWKNGKSRTIKILR